MQLGAYEILGELGRGGMGAVYRARASDGRDVAIKVLLNAKKDLHVDRFDRERRLLAALGESDGFVPLLDGGLTPQGPYLVMPFLGGGTLRDRLKKGPLSIDETAALGVALARACGKAHERGIVHRDLKPENVLYAADGRPLIADLGLAKHFRSDVSGASQSVALSKTGESLGTAGYMAPEQMNDAKSVGPPADVFSIGTILYECLTGSAAFAGDSSHARFAAVATGTFVSVRKLRRDAPRWLAQAIERAILPNHAERWSDGAAFAQGLEGRRVSARLGARSAVVVVLGLAVVGGVAGAAALARRSAEPQAGPGPAAAPPPAAAVRGTVGPPPGEAPGLAPARAFLKTRWTRLHSTLGRYDLKHLSGCGSIAISPDGKLAASGSYDGTLKLWSLEKLGDASPRVDEVRSHGAHKDGVDAVAFSPDGRVLLSGGHDKRVKLWEVDTGRLLREATGHGADVVSIAVLPDGKRFVTASHDKTVRVWDLETAASLRTFEGHPKRAYTVAVSPDGRLAASTGEEGTIRLWDLAATGQTSPVILVSPVNGDKRECFSATWSRDGKTLATASNDGTVTLWETTGFRPTGTIRGHEGGVWPVRFLADGNLLTAGFDGTVRLWNTTELSLLKKLGAHVEAVIGLAVSPDGRRALSASFDHRLRVWDLDRRTELALASGHSDAVLAIAAGGRAIVTGGADGTARLWDTLSGREQKPLAGHDAPVTAAGLSREGRFAVTGSADGKLRFFDLASGAPPRTLDAHKGKVVAAHIWEEGRVVLSLGEDGACRTWELGTGETQSFGTIPAPGRSIGFPPADYKAATMANAVAVDGQGAVRVYELGHGREYRVWNGPKDPATFAAYFPIRPPRVLIGCADGTLRVLETDTQAETQRGLVHHGAVECFAASTDGRFAVTCGSDRAVRLVRLPSCEPLDRIDLATSGDVPTSVTFLPGDRSFLVGTRRGVVLRFELSGDAR